MRFGYPPLFVEPGRKSLLIGIVLCLIATVAILLCWSGPSERKVFGNDIAMEREQYGTALLQT